MIKRKDVAFIFRQIFTSKMFPVVNLHLNELHMLHVPKHFPQVVVQQSSVIRLWGHIQLKLCSPIKF